MSKNIVQINLGKLENTCFVVMPFNPLFQAEYDKSILPALSELGIKCIRGDEIYTRQRIMDDIWRSIRSCRFVLADLSGKNPNVLYELGLAHAIGKPAIIITRNEDDVPFDLKHLRYLFYDINDPSWGENLKYGIQNLVSKIIENPDIEKYLDGIDRPIAIEFSSEKIVANADEITIDITGVWIGSFSILAKHHVVLKVMQNEKDLYAAATISYPDSKDKGVIQQVMIVTIKDRRVIFQGVNYTYIESGDDEGYDLDTFDLILDSTNRILKGSMIDENLEEPVEFILTKQ